MPKQRESVGLADRAKDALRGRRFEEAAALLREARQAPPETPTELRTLADVALVLQDREAAAELLDAATARSGPDGAPSTWYRVLGELRAGQGKLDQAIRAFRTAVALAPAEAEAWRWLVRLLRTVNDLPAAIAAARQVVDLVPGEWPAHHELATLLMEARAFDEADVELAEAAVGAGDAPAVAVSRARLDGHRGRSGDALPALAATVDRHPRYLPALAALALALREQGRYDESGATFRRAIDLAPTDATLWCGLGRTLLEAGRAGDALTVARALLARRPGHAGALALEALAHTAQGNGEGAAYLLDHERFVVTRSLPVPEGFPDLPSFNAALAATVARHPTLHRAPLSHATAAGLHSGSLLVDAPPEIGALKRSLQVAVADYSRALPRWPDHPFVSHQPASALFDIWCVVMERGGHQTPHIHPQAWLSGCYYPQLPAALRSGEGPAGWLSFGEPDREFPRQGDPRIVLVRPVEGLLVLFPSYFYHRTVPFDAEGTRISVAFDLVPTDR